MGALSDRGALHVSELDVDGLMASTREVFVGIDRVLLYTTPLVTRFRAVTGREGLLVHGRSGWGEAAPFWDYDPGESSRWLRSAIEAATVPPPASRRDSIPVNVTIPVCTPEQAAARVRASGGCRTAKVKVADPGQPLSADIDRVAAVAEALVLTSPAAPGAHARSDDSTAHLRVDANAAWSRDQAVDAIRQLDRAAAPAGGLEYVEQPCFDVEDLAAVRRAVDVPLAADESIRRAPDPLTGIDAVVRAQAADIAVVKVAPLGGLTSALEVAARTGLEIVVSSAVETSIGLDLGVRMAACLPELRHACGLATAQLLVADVTAHSLLPVDGAIGVLDHRPSPDPGILATAPPVDDDRVVRWRERLDLMTSALLTPHTAAPGRGGR